MHARLTAILVMLFLVSPLAFGMQVPSQGHTDDSVPVKPHPGGAAQQLSTQETVLIAVGAVCATILLLALLN